MYIVTKEHKVQTSKSNEVHCTYKRQLTAYEEGVAFIKEEAAELNLEPVQLEALVDSFERNDVADFGTFKICIHNTDNFMDNEGLDDYLDGEEGDWAFDFPKNPDPQKRKLRFFPFDL